MKTNIIIYKNHVYSVDLFEPTLLEDNQLNSEINNILECNEIERKDINFKKVFTYINTTGSYEIFLDEKYEIPLKIKKLFYVTSNGQFLTESAWKNTSLIFQIKDDIKIIKVYSSPKKIYNIVKKNERIFYYHY